MQLAFVPCQNNTSDVVCKSPEEIKSWLLNKFIVILVNQDEFVKHKFGEESMNMESYITWKALTPVVPTEFVYSVERSLVKLNDSVLGLHTVIKEEKNGFTYK